MQIKMEEKNYECEEKMHIGQKIKDLIENKKLSKTRFADELGMSRRAVYDLFLKPDVNTEVLRKVAIILGVELSDLIESGEIPVLNDEPGVYVTGNISSVRSVFKELYVGVPFLSAKAQAGLPYISYDYSDVKWITETYPVFMPLVNITDRHIAIEVRGDSMEPEIKSGAIVLVESISGNDWSYESGGVYAILYGPGRLVVKRIRTNEIQTEKVLRLQSDNPQHGPITVQVNEIHRMWKVLMKVAEIVR